MEVIVLTVLIIIMILIFKIDSNRKSFAQDTAFYQRDVKDELSLIRKELILFNSTPARWAPPAPVYTREQQPEKGVPPPPTFHQPAENAPSPLHTEKTKPPHLAEQETAKTEKVITTAEIPTIEAATYPTQPAVTTEPIPLSSSEEEKISLIIDETAPALEESENSIAAETETTPTAEPQDIENATAQIAEPTIIPLPVYEQESKQTVYQQKASDIRIDNEAEQTSTAPSATAAYLKDDEPDFWTRFMEKNPDLEKFIGENLINKIGIAVLVLGIAFFVKYAIDQNWISEVGRVSIGILCGATLVGIAHYLRNSYRSFSSVLAGGGIAVFYFTIAFAFHQYHLMSQAAAFGIMVVITAFGVMLSTFYNRLELAIIATIGGFAVPFMVSTGDGNYVVLFTYLSILNSGLLTLAYFKKWKPLNIISLGFTIIIFGGWLITRGLPSGNEHILTNALVFASIFYILFLGMNIVNPVKNKTLFKPFDFSLLMGINALYFSSGMIITHYLQAGKWQGAFTVWMGTINLCLAWLFFKKVEKDKNLLYLLIGLTLTFFTLAIPVQLHGHTITLFWSAEFVLLYWLCQQSKIELYKYSSALVAMLSIISLMMDWYNASNAYNHLALIFTNINGFVTNVVSILCLGLYAWLINKENGENEYLHGIRNKEVKMAAMAMAGMMTYLTLIFGVNLFCNVGYTTYPVPNTYHILINELLAITAIWYLNKKKDEPFFLARMVIIIYCLAYYLCSTNEIFVLRNMTLSGKYPTVHYIVHWLDVGLLFTIFYLTISFLRKNSIMKPENKPMYTWIFSIALLGILSIEGLHAYVSVAYVPGALSSISYQYGKAGLTILWTLASFAFLWMGMKHRHKPLRIIGLSLFALVLVKLFLFDIRGISEGGKIAAFILLGVILLTVSFMYQKLKKMLIDDKE